MAMDSSLISVETGHDMEKRNCCSRQTNSEKEPDQTAAECAHRACHGYGGLPQFEEKYASKDKQFARGGGCSRGGDC